MEVPCSMIGYTGVVWKWNGRTCKAVDYLNNGEYPLCVRCGRPVKVFKDDYELFEQMHWLCFHLEFEHGDFDPDEPCSDPSCPWNRIPGIAKGNYRFNVGEIFDDPLSLTPEQAEELLAQHEAEKGSSPAEVRLMIRRRREEILRITTRRNVTNVRFYLDIDGDNVIPTFLAEFHPSNLLTRSGLTIDLKELFGFNVRVIPQETVTPYDLERAEPL